MVFFKAVVFGAFAQESASILVSRLGAALDRGCYYVVVDGLRPGEPFSLKGAVNPASGDLPGRTRALTVTEGAAPPQLVDLLDASQAGECGDAKIRYLDLQIAAPPGADTITVSAAIAPLVGPVGDDPSAGGRRYDPHATKLRWLPDAGEFSSSKPFCDVTPGNALAGAAVERRRHRSA
ncbi:MAG: hypothetical protein IPK80_01210 [Nannocystis sp.]|nr:hypothetical protein [Nannocystis sp.]